MEFDIEPQMLNFAQNFGVVLFVYEVGLEVGPSFLRVVIIQLLMVMFL